MDSSAGTKSRGPDPDAFTRPPSSWARRHRATSPATSRWAEPHNVSQHCVCVCACVSHHVLFLPQTFSGRSSNGSPLVFRLPDPVRPSQHYTRLDLSHSNAPPYRSLQTHTKEVHGLKALSAVGPAVTTLVWPLLVLVTSDEKLYPYMYLKRISIHDIYPNIFIAFFYFIICF